MLTRYSAEVEEALVASGLAQGEDARGLAAWMLARSLAEGEVFLGEFPLDDPQGLRELYRRFLEGALREGMGELENRYQTHREAGLAPGEALAQALDGARGSLLPPNAEVLLWNGGDQAYGALRRRGSVGSPDALLRAGEGLALLDWEERVGLVPALLRLPGGREFLLNLQDEVASYLARPLPPGEALEALPLLFRGLEASARRMAGSGGDALSELFLAHDLPQEHLLVLDGLAQRERDLLRAVAEAAHALAEGKEGGSPFLRKALARWAGHAPAPEASPLEAEGLGG